MPLSKMESLELEKLQLEQEQHEHMQGAQSNGSAPLIQGELPLSTRAALSFTDSPEEKRAYLEKQYPGAKFSQRGQDELIQLAGEENPRYVKAPGWGLSKVADFAGDIPEAVGGMMAGAGTGAIGAGAGMAAGNVAKKAIAYGLLGIPRKDTLAENAMDAAASGVGGGLLHKAISMVPGAASAVRSGVRSGAEKLGGLLGGGAKAAEGAAADAFAPEVAAAAPKSLKEVGDIVQKAKESGALSDLPSAKIIENGEKYLPDLKYPLIGQQKEALTNKGAYAKFQTLKSDPTIPGSRQVIEYEGLQKKELGDALDSTLAATAGRAPVEGATERGEGAIKTLLDKYEGNKRMFGEAIGNFKDTPIDPAAHMPEFRDRVLKAFPQLGKFMDPETGAMKPYTRASGLNPKVYGMLNDVHKLMGNEQLTIPEMSAIRESLRQEIDATNPKEAIPINRLRSTMLDHIQSLVQKVNPEADVKGAFRGYAKNEGNLEQLEKTMGGDLSSLANFTQKVKPETALPRIFSNTNTVKLAKEAYGQDFKSLSADYLQSLKEAATDANGNFSSAKFSTALRKNAPALREAFKENPGTLNRIQAIADRMRIIPDAPPFNSSNTAPANAILQAARHAKGALGAAAEGNMGETAKSLKEMVAGPLENRAKRQELEAMLRGEEGEPTSFLTPARRRGAAAFVGGKAAQGLLQQDRENRRGLMP